jgi:hypothetical protein
MKSQVTRILIHSKKYKFIVICASVTKERGNFLMRSLVTDILPQILSELLNEGE